MTAIGKKLLAFSFLFFFGFVCSAEPRINFEFSRQNVSPYVMPPFVSAVINDQTDPARVTGIALIVQKDTAGIPAAQYHIRAETTNSAVAGEKDFRIEKQDGNATLYITPSAAGYTDITLTLQYLRTTRTLILHYAVSLAGNITPHTTWHTGNADASAALPVGSRYMLVADDEINRLYLFNRQRSGLPLLEYPYAVNLDLTDGVAPFYKEVDVEASTFSPHNKARTYWIGSMTNSSSFANKPNRNRLFAVDLSDTGRKTTLSFAGDCDHLRQQLINWGDDNGYQFSKAARVGQNPKAVDGFNIEGMAFAPDGSTLYIGFRAPLVPVSGRNRTVIAPIENFETWFNNGNQKGKPFIGKPIELNLGGRGIRDMIQLSNGVYVIVAGSSGENATGAIFRWSGSPSDSAVLLTGFAISNLKIEAVVEVDDDNGNLVPNALQVLSDNGNTIFYNDNIPAKQLSNTSYKKFRSDIIQSTEPLLAKEWHPAIP